MEGKCYLCAHDAVFEDAADTTLNLIIDCQHCCKRRYRVTQMARFFIFERSDGLRPLNDDAKRKLIDYIAKWPENEIPVLDTTIIKALTGIVSEDIRHS